MANRPQRAGAADRIGQRSCSAATSGKGMGLRGTRKQAQRLEPFHRRAIIPPRPRIFLATAGQTPTSLISVLLPMSTTAPY